MGTHHLETYLNDHLAGAVAVLELIDHSIEQHADAPQAALLGEIRADIEADRRQLEMIIDRVGGSQSAPRKAVGWISDRVVRLKLRMDDPSNGALRLFETIEIVALGIEGKRSLWRTLDSLRADLSEIADVDFEGLIARATQQRDALEPGRLRAARDALASNGSTTARNTANAPDSVDSARARPA